MERTTKGGANAGFTLFEMLTVIAIIGILSAVGVISMNGMKNDALDGAQQIVMASQLARTTALETISVNRVTVAASGITIENNAGGDCTATTGWTQSQAPIPLPDRVSTTPTPWVACFNQRGLLKNTPAELVLTDQRGRSAKVDVYLTGQAEVVR